MKHTIEVDDIIFEKIIKLTGISHCERISSLFQEITELKKREIISPLEKFIESNIEEGKSREAERYVMLYLINGSEEHWGRHHSDNVKVMEVLEYVKNNGFNIRIDSHFLKCIEFFTNR